MRIIRLLIISIGVFAICFSCGRQSSCNKQLPAIKLHDLHFYDTINNVTLTFSLPDTSLFSEDEQLKFANIATGKRTNNLSAIFDSVKYNHRNMNIRCKMLYIDNHVASAQIDVENWVDSGDTLHSISHFTYLRLSKTKLTLQQIAQTPYDVDILTEWINLKTDHSTKLSPDVDITILNDSVVFHYDRFTNKRLQISLPLQELKDEFENLKTIYNE